MMRTLVICLALLAAIPAKAQLFPALGGQRVGISALTFLKIDTSPRSAGLAGASLCAPGDAYSVSVNPGAITDLQHAAFGLSHTFWAADINYSFASAIFPTKNQGVWAGSVSTLNSGAMPVRTVFQPGGTGEVFYVNYYTAGLTYARQPTDQFSFGVTGKYVHEQIAEFQANTGLLDLGFMYRTDFRGLRFGVVVQNFGPNSRLRGELKTDSVFQQNTPALDAYPAPTVFLLGISINIWENETGDQRLTGLLQLNHPNDNAENIRMGLEYDYKDLLFLRAGYRINVEDQPFPAFGMGIRARVGRHPLRFDYAADPLKYLGLMHRVGIGFYMNPA
jgi:hypothetical protein